MVTLPREVGWAIAAEWNMFPVERSGKRPLIASWPENATSNPAQLSAWAAQFPNCNWGLATGARSGIIVIDADGETGRASLASLGPPSTLTVAAGNGLHCYLSSLSAALIGTSVGRLGPGLDIRANGGYVVYPPSLHLSGRLYTFCDPRQPIVAAPTWFLEKLTAPLPLPVPPIVAVKSP